MTTIARDQAMTGDGEGVLVVTGGVDTHAHTHTAAALDPAGRLLGHATFPATGAGYSALSTWLSSFGALRSVGVEGTGSYGAGLCAHLAGAGIAVLEVNRPDRSARRLAGKADPLDAEAAARAVQGAVRTAIPKTRHGDQGGRVEALRVLRVARRSAIEQRSAAVVTMKTLIVTAPEALRAGLRGLGDRALLATCAGLRPDVSTLAMLADPVQGTKVALRALARRHRALSEEVTDLDALIVPLVEAINPALLTLRGVGPDVASQLIITAGANPHRVHSEAAFAMLCGVAPLPACSGKTRRYRLNRGGDRQANNALWRIVMCRMRWEERTRVYVTRRTTEGLSKKDIIRCLKRAVAREIYRVLCMPQAPTTAVTLAA